MPTMPAPTQPQGQVMPSMTLSKTLRSPEFYLLTGSSILSMACIFAFLGNSAQIAVSVRQNGKQVTMVALFSIFNSIGRLGFSYLSQEVLHRFAVGRTLLLASANFTVFLAQIMLLAMYQVDHVAGLYTSSILFGLGYGGQIVLFATCKSEIFGVRYFHIVYASGSTAAVLTDIAFNIGITGGLYQWAKDSYGQSGQDCIGVRCFRYSFQIGALLAALGTLLSLLLWYQTRTMYRKLHAQLNEP